MRSRRRRSRQKGGMLRSLRNCLRRRCTRRGSSAAAAATESSPEAAAAATAAGAAIASANLSAAGATTARANLSAAGANNESNTESFVSARSNASVKYTKKGKAGKPSKAAKAAAKAEAKAEEKARENARLAALQAEAIAEAEENTREWTTVGEYVAPSKSGAKAAAPPRQQTKSYPAAAAAPPRQQTKSGAAAAPSKGSSLASALAGIRASSTVPQSVIEDAVSNSGPEIRRIKGFAESINLKDITNSDEITYLTGEEKTNLRAIMGPLRTRLDIVKSSASLPELRRTAASISEDMSKIHKLIERGRVRKEEQEEAQRLANIKAAMERAEEEERQAKERFMAEERARIAAEAEAKARANAEAKAAANAAAKAARFNAKIEELGAGLPPMDPDLMRLAATYALGIEEGANAINNGARYAKFPPTAEFKKQRNEEHRSRIFGPAGGAAGTL